MASNTAADILRRAVDWSEIRPEWGLAGNAAFIVAPRSYQNKLNGSSSQLRPAWTRQSLIPRSHWTHYYAHCHTSLWKWHKTVHNVVGRFGVLSGNGGDLMTGLPWQSLHTGRHYQHLPLRLQVVIAAPRTSIQRVIDKHELVANLITNGWLHLLAIEEGGSSYRYTAIGSWEANDTHNTQRP